MSTAAFLAGRGEPPAPELLRARGLAAYAYSVLPAGHPSRLQFRGDYLRALARHQAIRQELVPLLTAWRTAGIEAFLFKGFQLAEYVYPAPGARFHGDVDVLIPGEAVPRALHVARGAGWRDVAYNPQPGAHNAFAIVQPGGATKLDVHRLLCAGPQRRPGPRLRITCAILDASVAAELGGVPVRIPTAADALVILALQRGWGDRWGCKPHDLPDTRLLLEHLTGGIADVLERADRLGCRRTVEGFLHRCHPATPAFRLGLPPLRQRIALDIATARERRAVPSWRPLRRMGALRLAPAALAAAAPDFLRVRRLLRSGRPVGDLLAAAVPRPAVAPAMTSGARDGATESTLTRRRVVRGVRWLCRLLPLNRDGDCLLRSLSVCAALNRYGIPAIFVSGVAREGGDIAGHAWVELDGQVLPEFDEAHNRQRYRVILEWPLQADRLVPQHQATVAQPFQ